MVTDWALKFRVSDFGTTTALKLYEATAARTSGRRASFGSTLAGIVASNAPAGRTRTSAPPAMSWTNSSTPCWVVAFETRTPNRIAKPSTMPPAVSAERPFLCASCLEPIEDNRRTFVTYSGADVEPVFDLPVFDQDD